MMTYFSRLARPLLPLAIILGSAAPALAATAPRLKSTHGDWTVYTRQTDNDLICYVLSQAKTLTPSNVNHGKVYFMVANWKSGAAKQQPSFLAGYPLKATRAAKAAVGSTNISMYGAQNEGFIQTNADERALVSKMRAGSSMTITATSERGTQTRSQFSLKGVTAALKAADKACS